MHRIFGVLAAATILAGCTGGSPASVPTSGESSAPQGPASTSTTTGTEPNATVPEPAEDTQAKTLHFEQTFSLTVTQVVAPYTGANPRTDHRVSLDPNCVGFGKDQVWLITNGTAQATWSSNGPFATKMTIDVRDIGLMASNNGTTSPGTLQYGPFQTVPNALLGLLFVVQPSDPGVVNKQPVTLHLSFDYFGKPDLKTNVHSCVYQTAAPPFDQEEVAP